MEMNAMSSGTTGSTARQPSPVVLVVDDEELIRSLLVEDLMDAGFETLEAGDATEALKILEERRDLSVLVTDVRMPGEMNGYFLAKRVRERWPYVQIVLVSGHAAPSRRELGFDCDFLVKPFANDELVRTVKARVRRGV